MPDTHYTLYTDGGSRGNPGPCAYGFVLVGPNGTVLAKEGRYIGEGTNNFAEYQALIAGLRKAKSMKIKQVQCMLDSELVVKQMIGKYKLKDKNIQEAFITVWNLRIDIGDVKFSHIPREKNGDADALVNEALDQQAKTPTLI